MRFTSIALATALLLAASAAHAQTTYTTAAAFQAASTTAHLYDFESIATAGSIVTTPTLTPLTVTVSGGGDPNVYVYSASNGGGGFSLNGTDSLIAGVNNESLPTTTIQLGGSFTAVGTEIGFRSGSTVTNTFTATLFNGATQVGSTYSSPSLDTGYIGFTSALPFDRILFTNNQPSPGYTAFDNLRTGNAISSVTPEPGSLALLIGLGATGAELLRRRRRSI